MKTRIVLQILLLGLFCVLAVARDISHHDIGRIPQLLQRPGGGGRPPVRPPTHEPPTEEPPTEPVTPNEPEAPDEPKAPEAPTEQPPPHAQEPPAINAGSWKPTSADVAEFDLQRVPENQEQLYWNFAEPADRTFFAKIFTFFVGVPGYEFLDNEKVYDGQTGENQPFQKDQAPYQDNDLPLTGQSLQFARTLQQIDDANAQTVITSAFDPRNALDVCNLFASLVDVCSGGGEYCGCYSGSYYVPDMANSLALGCAQYHTDSNVACDTTDSYCAYAVTASQYTNLCPPASDAVKFAATIDSEASQTETAAATTSASPASSPSTTSPPMTSTSTPDAQPASTTDPSDTPSAAPATGASDWAHRPSLIVASCWTVVFVVVYGI